MRRPIGLAAVTLTATAALVGLATAPTATAATHVGSHPFEVFASSSVEDAATHTVSLPRYDGSSHGQPVTYVITDASTREAAGRLGVNWAPRLANAAGTPGVQHASGVAASLAFPATVDFTPQRVLVPGPTGFPPADGRAGSRRRGGLQPARAADRRDRPQRAAGPQRQRSGRQGGQHGGPAGGLPRDRRVLRGQSRPLRVVRGVDPAGRRAGERGVRDRLNAVPPDFPKGTEEPAPPAREEIGIVTNGQTG